MILSTKIDTKSFVDISIPLHFNGPQPNAYGFENATSKPCEAGDLVGDTRRGGSCNFEQYTFIPHCNGTHTECIGHITHERISIRDCLRDVFIPAMLISVEPEKASETDETYVVKVGENDLLITRKALQLILSEPRAAATGFQDALGAKEPHRPRDAASPPLKGGEPDLSALIIRTLPNDESKLTRQYGTTNLILSNIPPFFSTEAMEYIVGLGVKHLLVDLPSIDRMYDEGKLSNHRIFWNVEQGSFETNPDTLINSTITELIYVPNEIKDGNYLLNLQIAPFMADASPSRPILFKST